MELKDTICAVATPQGGALGVIRISGPEAIDIAGKIFTPRGKQPLAERQTPCVVFGDITNDRGEQLDEVLLTMMRAPRSYTGEDTVEISCHASPYIIQQLMLHLIDKGARQAEPGEYTMRAFLNGKLDLSRAEAVADLIASSSEASHRLAMNHLKGGFSRELDKLREKLLKLTTLMELELDFGEEDVTFADSMGHEFFMLPDKSYFYQDIHGLLLCGKAYRLRDGIVEQLTNDEDVLDTILLD